MEYQRFDAPPLPIDPPNGGSAGQPPGGIEAEAPNHVPPHSGSYVCPQTMRDRLAVQSFAAERGMAVFTPFRSWCFDTILYDVANDRVLKVVVEDRWTIDSRYIGLSDIWIVFRIKDELYWMPHDEMIRAAEADGFSWNTRGVCTRTRLSASMRSQCEPYRITPEPGEFWLAMPKLAFS
jgi:hypothetical protein